MSDDNLRGELMDIDGVGEATADSILEILNKNDISAGAPEDVVELLEEAIDHFEKGEGNVTMQQGAERVRKAVDLLQEGGEDE